MSNSVSGVLLNNILILIASSEEQPTNMCIYFSFLHILFNFLSEYFHPTRTFDSYFMCLCMCGVSDQSHGHTCVALPLSHILDHFIF